MADWIVRTLTPHDLSLDKTSLGSLAKKYGSTPKEIAQRNNVAWNSSAINAWVLSVGGKEVTPGNFSFTVGNKLLLPSVAVVPDPKGEPVVAQPIVASAVSGGMPWWGWLGLLGGGIWLYRRRKKRKKTGTSAKIVRF